ncbi:hypothetical protein BDV30DRAFT_231598 [Aspergillus minisclerotigenes]|uniref:Involucrin repeat protein n=1 Tax=Aspergillus minisclerotigenes TaxID=656917 RepID=A0A5N6ING3_9EURO|nr:hypothetical protein BDV30DRAFT_231598 [Aspergillus minisclerotigenes]
MFKALLAGGRSSDARSSSSSTSSSRRRTESKASSTVSRKPSRGDDRDRGLGDLSAYQTSGNRSKRYAPSAAGDSVASSYATAEPHSVIEPDRNVIERAPRRRDTDDSERRDRYSDSDDSDDKPRRRRNRSRSQSRERTSERPDNTDELDNGNRGGGHRRERRRTQPDELPSVPISGAEADLAPKVGTFDYPQFPPPFHDTHPVTSMPSSPNVPGVYDPHVQQQFPGQFPAFVAEPYPPNPAGAAADYYGDQGQSVAQQPGVRPEPPKIIPNTQAHLMPASPHPNPPQEPSSMGQTPAAADYYADDTDPEIQAPEHSSKPPAGPTPKPPRPTIQTEGVLGPAATATVHDEGRPQGIGSGSSPLLESPTPTSVPLTGTSPSKPPNAQDIGTAVGAAAATAAAGYIMGHHHQSSLNVEHPSQSGNQNNEEGFPNLVGPAGPSAYSDQLNAPPLNTAGAETTAYAADPSHPHHAALYHGAPFQSGGLAFQQRQRGPLDKFIDFWRDAEGVGMFEDYTETIGVCRHCFEPGTSSRDAPRRHYYRRRRRSSDRYSSRSRVGKPSRYSSSEDEGRRRKKTSISSWLPGMLAGYTPFIKKDFENTYSDRSGRPASSPSDNENLSTLEKQSHTSRGVYGRSPRRSYEGLRDNESRRLSRSTSRSSSKSEKHCAHRDVGTAITGVSENQPRRSRSPRKTKSRKSSSSESSFVDISRPSMKSVGGLSSFFTASENRRKRQSKKRISIFSFNNSSSSSLDADLAFGNGYAKRPPGKSKRRGKKKDQDDVDAALLGIGAAATAIADSTHHRSRRTGGVLMKKEPTPTRLGYSSSSTNDDAWEDVDSGDQSSSSVSSALAFGGSGLYGSTASPSSDSGTSLWGWRWGNRKGKKQKRTRSNASESRFPTNAALTAGALGTAALAHRYNNQGRRTSEGTGSGAGNLQHVAPVPTSDPSQFDAVNVPPSPPQPVIRPRGHIPLQQPQPVAPVSQAVYTSQGETIPPYTVPSRPPPFVNTLSHYDYQAQGSGLREHGIPLYRDFTDIRSNVNRPPRRSDSSPVFHTEPLVSTSVPSAKRRSTMKDQGSVQFDLTREQAEKERRADHFEHQKHDHGSQGVELIDREAHADKNRSRRYYEGHRDSDFGSQEGYGREPRGERGPASWADLGTSAGSVLSGQSFNGNPSESSQRSHQERSEKRRAERRRASGSEISSGLPMPECAYDDVDQRPNPVPAQEHFKTSVFRDIPRKKPVHDNYAQFFAPKELRYSPDTYARREPASTPTIIEAEPASQKIKATEEHHPEYRGLPWPVPKLNVVEPTPPQSQSGSVRDIASPIPSPPEVLDDDRKSKRSTTGSRVSWGKDETREYEVPSTSSELDSADHDIVADRGQEKQTDSEPTREIAAIQADLPKATNGYNPDIVVAATAGAAAEALGFDPSLVSAITEKLVSPSRAGSYVGGAVTPDDGEKQPILKKSFENGPLYSEPVSISDSVRTFHDDQQPSSIAQEVIQQLSGEQASEMGELSGRTVEKPNEAQPTLVFRDERSGTKSAPEEVSHISGGFELEESTSQREPRGNTQEPVQDNLRSIIPAVIPRHSDTPMEGANCSKYSRDSDIPSQASPPAAEEGSTIEKKKRKKRHSKRGSGTFDDSVSVASSPARVEETSYRGRSTDEQTKEKRAGGILSNIFGSKVSEPLASRKSSSDSYPSREVQSEVGPPDSGESRRQRREEKRRQKYGELADSGKTTEREKDRTISQDGDDQPSFLAGSPEMPYQMRPLWLVEHHGSKIEVQPEEPLPSLPSSKTSSVNASAEDLASLQDEKIWEKLDLSPSIHGDQRPIDVDMPSNSQHRVLDSEEMNTNQLLRKDKPKYEFHSPSELLQDPSTYPELPPSPTMGALPSAEGSAVGVKDDGGLERNLDNLPPLPLSRPATPEMEQIRASDAAEGHRTRELTAPDLEAPRTSGHVAPSADGDTTIMNVLNVDLPELQPSNEKTPTKATQGNIESGDALMSDEPTSRDLSNEVVPVPPAVQIPTTEAIEKGREDPGYAATSPTEVVNSTIADPLLPAGEERVLSAEPLQAVTTDETKAGISDTADEITQPQEAQRGTKSEPQKSATGDNESLGSAEAKPESNSNLTSATIISVEGEETEAVDEAAVTESTKPTRESTGKAADGVAQAPTEEGVVGATSPSLSKKKKKDKKKKPKSVNIHEPESQDTPATALAALSNPEDVERIDGAITQGESSIEQISLPEGTDKPSEAEVESAIDLSKPDEAANVQAPVDMPISEPEPVVDIIKTEDALATENELAVTDLKAGEEADTQIKEGRLPSDWEPTAQAVNPQNVVDLAASTNPSKQEPPLEIPQSENAHLASDTSATEQKPNSEVLVTDVTWTMQAPEATTIPVQGLPKAEDAPIITDVLSPEQAMPRAEEEAYQESLESDKMLDSNAKPAATDSEVAADTDVLTNNLETDEDRRKESKSFDANEEPSRSAIDDYQPVKEALLPSEEITSSSEHPVQGTTEGAESLELSGQDAVLPETPFEQPELQESTEHNTSVREEAPGVVFEPSSAVLEQPTEAASVSDLGGQNSSAAGLQEGLSSEMSAVDPAPVESESGPLQLESEQTTRTDEAKAPMEPSSGQISPEQQQMQGNPAAVEPISSPEPAAEIADAGTKTQGADVTDAQTENSLSRRNCNNMEKSKCDSDTEPPVEKVVGDVPPDVPSNDGATPRAEDEPAIPPKEEPEARQPEEAPDNAHEGAINVSPETMSGAVSERPIESQDAGSAETAQKAGSEEAPEGQPTKKGKKKKKNRKSISSDPQAVADAETQPPLSAEGLPAETPLAEKSGLVYPTDDKHIPQDATATNKVAETTEAVDAIPAAENESNVPMENPAETNHSTLHIAEHVPDDPVPDAEPEAGESTPAGKKNKKKKKKKQSLPSLPDAHVAASEPTSNTEVASPNIDIPVAIEKPPATEGQELVQEEAAGSEQPLDVTEAVEDSASPETAPAMSAAEKKKTKKEQKKHRKSASLDETVASDRAINPSPENASLERDPTSEHGASTEEPTVVDELANTEPAVALNEGLDEQSQEPARQEPEETPTDIAGVSAIEAGNLELDQTQHTDHTPLDSEGTPENEKHSGADAGERHMVERMGVEQETTGEKKVEVESGDATLEAAPTMNADTALEQPKEEAPSEEAAPEETIAADIPLTDIVPQDTPEQPHEEAPSAEAAPEQTKDTDMPLIDVVPQDTLQQSQEGTLDETAVPEHIEDADTALQPQEGTLNEKFAPEQTEDAEISLTDVIPQNAKSKKDKKKKKKQQSISLADDQPAAAREEIVEEPSDARSDILEIPGQPQLSFPDNVAEESQRAFSEKPTQQPESNEPEPTESPEQVDLTRPVEPEPMADTQESVSKKKAKKDKKKRKSVSFANNEQEAPTKSSEATETTEASHHPREITSDLHKGVPTVAFGKDGSESNKEVVQVTQPYNDSVTEAQASTLGPIDPDPMGQTPSVARELVNETTVPEGGYANDDASVTEPLEEQVQQGTGILTAPETSEKHEVESAPEASVPETPPTSVQESTAVVQEAEQESGPSKSKKDKKKKKKRKTQETIENETSVVPEPSIEEAPVQAEEDNGTAAPGVIEEVIEPDNAAKPSEISSQDVPSMVPESIVEHVRAETEQVVDGTVHEVNESEGTEQQAREQPEIPKNDGAPAMSAKERKKAKKKERKRQSKNLDGSGAASTAAESASIVPEEKTQGPLINASTTSTGDVAHEATATQVSAGLKPSDPSVDTATLPAEDDGKENQSHGTESHGENDENLFWTDHMVSSQVDQQQATPVDSPTQPVPENTKAEKVVVSGESVTMSEQIEVGTEDHASTTEQEATSEADWVSLEHLPAEDVSAETDESGKVFTPNWDELKTQRDTTAKTTGQGARKDTMPGQTDEKLEEKDQEAVPEASLVAVEVPGTSVDYPLATDEKAVSFSPAEAGVPEDLRETNTGSAIDVEKPEAIAPWKDLHQAQQPDDSQPGDDSSRPNLVSTTSTEHDTREAKDSELEVSNAGPATENDTNEDRTASPRETRLEGVDLVSDSQTVEESRCSGAEVTNKSKSAEASCEIQAEPEDLLSVSSGEENREDKETPSMSDTAREKPDGRETTAELPEANKRATLDPVESLGPRSQPLAEKELQASIESTPELLNHEELKSVSEKGEEENMTQTLSRKASKKQKKKAKKQAKATSLEMADPLPAESKRGINEGSNLEAIVGSTAITEKPMQDQVQGPQSVSGVSKPVFEAVAAQTQATHELQEGEDKDAETQGKLSSQTSEGGDPEAAEERIGGHSTQQETPAPGTVSKEVGGRSKQEAGLQIPERAEQPASGGNTESTEVALLVHEAKPESSEPPMTEVSTAEKSPFEASSRENTQKIEEDLSVKIKEPEEIGSTSGKANVKPSQDQSAKDDEWPLIDWEKEKVDALEQTPQSSPEAVAAPFEPDESAEAIEAKANMGPQGQDSEAKLATPEEQFAPSREEPKTEPILEAAREHSLDDSISGKQAMGDTGSVSQKQSKIASIFPSLERGSFRRPITTKSSESVKDGAEDETNDQGASRGDAMQVSEAPIAATYGKDNDHIANPFMASERTTTATLEDVPGGTTVHDIQVPVASRLAQGNHKNPEDVLYTEAESAETGFLAREIPLYEPTPIHEQRSTFISSSSNAMCIDRQASPGSLRQLGRSPSIQGKCDPSPRPKPSEEATPPAQPNSTLPSSAFGVPSVVDRGAISPPRTPLQPIAEHEPIDRTRTPIGVMHQEQGTPCLEMKPEHVLPRPETLIRKFTDNALARQAWPTLDKDGDQDFHIRKRGSARSIDHEWPTGAIQTPEIGVPILRPSSMGSIKSVRSAHSQRSLRRMDRSASGDLRTASQAQTGARQSSRSPQPPPVEPPPSDFNIEHIASSSSYDPVTDKGKRPLRDMADVYHLQELETRLDQLASENRLLVAAREAAEDKLRNASVARRKSDHALNERAADLRDREAEVEQLKNSVEWLQKEVSRLTEENEGLTVANSNITVAHAAEIQTIRASSNRELDDLRLQNQQLSSEMQDRVRKEIDAALAQKNMELRRLREDLESARDKVKELQQRIAASMQDSVLVFRDEDYFDAACQKLCGHVQQWVLRFSKHSDLRRCRKLDDIQDEKIADRFENAILDGSDADVYLSDRVRRRDVFMSVVMTMVWEFIFTRYLFGMDREQRQKLKSLEKQLVERQNDTEAVALEIFETLSRLLPPPSNVEPQLLESLRKVLRVAVNLSIEMRTQLAEYIMLPPLQPEYDTNGDLARQVYFNASLMNERSGETTSNEELESQQAVVRVVLFPLVVKKGNDAGEGEDEVVVCPAQVLVARSPKDKKVTRMLSGDRMSLDGTRSIHSIAPSSTMDMSNVI